MIISEFSFMWCCNDYFAHAVILRTSRHTYRELHLIVLISGYKWPPALDPLLFEDRNGGQLLLISDHVNRTLLGCLGATREPV